MDARRHRSDGGDHQPRARRLTTPRFHEPDRIIPGQPRGAGAPLAGPGKTDLPANRRPVRPLRLSGRADLSSRPPQNPIPPNALSNRLNRLLTLSGFTVEKNAIAITLRTGKLYPGLLPRNYPIARNRPFRVVHKGESASPAGTMPVQPKNFTGVCT